MLPKIDVPIYDLQLLSLKDKVRFRPFTVKEEKLFLMASESEDKDTILTTIKQVVNNCLVSKVDVDNLPIFDLEYLFINLRAKSVNEEVKLNFKCNNIVEDKKCNHIVELVFNLLDIKPSTKGEHKNKVEVSKDLGIMLKYPSVKSVTKHSDKSESDAIFDIMVDCIDYIYDKEQIYYSKDTPRKELVEFLESLQTKNLESMRKFFETMPKIKSENTFKCTKCGFEDKLIVEGIENFFV